MSGFARTHEGTSRVMRDETKYSRMLHFGKALPRALWNGIE